MQHLRRYGVFFPVPIFAVATGMVWYAVFTIEAAGRQVTIRVFDVGQGDAIFIATSNGNQVLVDGGPDRTILERLGETMPPWDRALDLLVLTHPHADHVDGLLEVARRYNIGLVMESGVNHSIPEYEEWHKLLREKSVRVTIAKAGQRVRLSDSSFLDILAPFESFVGQSPKDVHDAMVVLKFSHGKTAALLMGDAERPLERQLTASGADLDVDVLKVGHHGSKTSTSEEFLGATTPQVAVISVGRKNRYGHPAQEVLDRFDAAAISVYRTDRDGTVTVGSDGEHFEIVR